MRSRRRPPRQREPAITATDSAASDTTHAEELRGIFAKWSHQCRNVLFRIQASLDLLEMESANPRITELVGCISSAQDQLVRLQGAIENCLSDLQIRRCDCELSGLVRDAWSEVRRARPDKPAELELLASEPVYSCCVDESAVRQALVEVVKNAFDATDDGVKVQVTLEETENDGVPIARVAIRNFGNPLSDHELQRMFDAFFTTKRQSAGIGLTVARRAIRAHGGDVYARNVAPRGVEILIVLPIDEAQSKAPAKSAPIHHKAG